jgi:hypothetical protein
VKPVRALLIVAGVAALVYPLGARELARRGTLRRVERLSRTAGAGCALEDAALSARRQRLGPLLASWETIGGCGAGGGTNGSGIKWVGRNTSGGLFQALSLNNYISIPQPNQQSPGQAGFNFITNNQLTHDFTDKWNAGLSIPYAYKWYRNPFGDGPMWNGGLADTSAMATRKLGTDNSTLLTGIVVLPTGTYKAVYVPAGTTTPLVLSPTQQLGYGKVTGSLLIDHIFDQDWGLIIVGGAANYRGGKQSADYYHAPDGTVFSEHWYRAPGATAYAYAGYFLGPLVPTLGINVVGTTGPDTRGDFGDTVGTPVLSAAGQASLEWSNPYFAVLLGAYLPLSIYQDSWQDYGHLKLQAWTVALGLSASPF